MSKSRPVRWMAALAFALTLPVYLLTMNRTIGFIDRGELAAAAYTLGIPHPTGYPTLIALGFVVSHLVPLRPVVALNGLAAVLVAISVAMCVLLFDELLRRVGPVDLDERKRSRLALLASLGLGLSATWWHQANGFEVYSLHVVFVPLVCLLFLRWVDRAAEPAESTGPSRPARGHRDGFVFALLLGLSFTNHMTTVLLAPGLLALAYLRFGDIRKFSRETARLTPPFLLGLLPYALLPIISARKPRFDWGGTHRLSGFVDHLTAREFRAWMFASPDTFAHQTRFLLHHLPRDFAWVGLVVAVAGAALLLRRERTLALAVALVIATSALYACGYRIRDLESYLVGCVFGIGLFAGMGLLWMHERLGHRWAIVTGVVLVLLNGALHYQDCDESGNRLAEDLTRNELASLPPHAVLFTAQWDYGLSASYYFQEVEGLRRDVVVISPDLLRYGWYVDELAHRAPALVNDARPEAEVFRAALRPFENHESYDASAIGMAYRAFTDSLAARAMRRRPVLCTREAARVLSGPWIMVPRGFALELRSDTTYVADAPPYYHFEPWPGHMDAYVATTHWIYADAFVQRAGYERDHGRARVAEQYLSLAARFDPNIQLDRVPPLALDGNALVAQSAGFFEGLARPSSSGSSLEH